MKGETAPAQLGEAGSALSEVARSSAVSAPVDLLARARRRVHSHEATLPRRLGVWSAAAAMVGLIIGSGIFRVPSSVAANVNSVGAIGAVWVLGGLFALCGALVFAELAAMFPKAGGRYVFLRECYGPLPAFLFGWTHLLVLRPSANGAIALIFASYATHWVDVGPVGERWIAAAVIIAVAVFNYRSVLLAAVVENVMSAAKLVALLGIALLAFLLGSRAEGAFAAAPEVNVTSWGGFALALITVMWTYSGWGSMTSMAGEIRDPGRNLPRALIWGVLAVVVAYLAVNAAYLYVLPLDEMAASTSVAADAMSGIFGSAGASVVAGLVMLSTFGALVASTMFGPRIYYAMAQDGLLFGSAGRVHTRYQTPHVATLISATLAVGYVSFRSFEQLAGGFILGSWPFYVLVVLAVFVFRVKRPELDRPYRTWGYPFVPVIFLILSVAMVLSAVLEDPTLALFGLGGILLGIPWYYLLRSIHSVRLRKQRRRRSSSWRGPPTS